MYSESDIEAAITAGAISPAAADAFRNHVAQSREAPAVDEESFRLLSGFNDIFVSIAIALLLTALAWIGGTLSPALGGALVAATGWGLAEYFTRRRRMALPSILLLLAFVAAVGATLGILLAGLITHPGAGGLPADERDQANALMLAAIGVAMAVAAWLHWRRFHVPITVAAGAAALVAVLIGLALAAIPGLIYDTPWFALVGGIGIFCLAMWWDGQDRSRVTRRSDVAFWLHLVAAPMIAHPIFHQLGVMNGGAISIGTAVFVIALYLFFALVSLTIDRRALLVSSLAYVLYAMSALFEQFGAVSLNVALTAMVIGSALLLLSAFWYPVRRIVVGALPGEILARIPILDRPAQAKPA